jgi:hypothetical protein
MDMAVLLGPPISLVARNTYDFTSAAVDVLETTKPRLSSESESPCPILDRPGVLQLRDTLELQGEAIALYDGRVAYF